MDRSFLLLLLLVFLPLLGCSSAPSPTISLTCAGTRNPTHCTRMLEKLPAKDLLHISLNATLRHVSAALNGALSVSTSGMGGAARAAYEDCIELLDDSVDLLSRSVGSIGGAREDVMTWLSAALTNHDTCTEGMEAAGDGRLRQEMTGHLKDLDLLVSNCLAIFSSPGLFKDFAGVPVDNSRFPAWVTSGDRKLLRAAEIGADLVVSKGGENGTYATVAEAVKAAPENSSRRFVIYIKAGRYDENVKVARKKINLMFVGDGKGKTIIAGCRSIFDNITTFRTATFAATGAGLIMRDMTIENWAGPNKHQAVALRIGADHAVIYRCSIIGYQDTLYVHSQRQFFRECDIYGTVDFIFGNAAVVFQKCGIWARKPLPMQKITITAQNRKDPNQNTGISIHNCQILPTPDLSALAANSSAVNASLAAAAVETFLGRPWKMYSRVVYLLSYMGGHVEPRGWLEWNQTFALDTLYYGEYLNSGPGSALGKRVQWPGYKVIKLPEEASKFTVANFIFGSSWLPSTGVAYLAGLSL